MKRLFYVILSIVAINSYGQNIYGTINSFDKYLVLSKYYFVELQTVDTIHLQENNTFSYSLKNLNVGQYNLSNDNVNIDFIVDKDKKDIKIYYDPENVNSFRFLSSKPNEDLLKFYKFYDIKFNAYDVLNTTLKYYPEKEEFYNQIVHKKELLKQEINKRVDSINSLYNNYLINQIVNSYRLTDDKFIAKYNYDTIFAGTKILGSKIFEHLNKYQTESQSYEERQKIMYQAVDDILNAFISNPDMETKVAGFLIEQFQHYDLNLIVEYTADKSIQLIDNKKISKNLQEDYNWIKAIVNTKLNAQAPDFKIDKKHNFSDLKSKYKILIFWASWCPHCEDFMHQFEQVDQNSLKDYKVVTYSLDFEKETWETKIKEFPKNWINLCECKSEENVPDKYAIYATPTIFVLDSENKIIAKPMSFEDLDKFISEHF